MTPFDETTEKKADELYGAYGDFEPNARCFTAGRDSCRESLEILARAISLVGTQCYNTGMYGILNIRPGECDCSSCEIKKLIAQVRSRGDWPLGEK